ncbi:MAG TPA: GNAT family N-acetyltransferase [Methylobacter sp.]
MRIRFTSYESIKWAEEISIHLLDPRLWIPRIDYPDLEKWAEKVYSQLLSEKKRATTAIIGGSVVAVIIYQKKQDSETELEIKNISVRPDQQGRHITSFLLRNAEIEGIMDFGTKSVIVDAKEKNLAIRSFLIKNGYVPEEIRDLYGINSGNDIIYREIQRIFRKSALL